MRFSLPDVPSVHGPGALACRIHILCRAVFFTVPGFLFFAFPIGHAQGYVRITADVLIIAVSRGVGIILFEASELNEGRQAARMIPAVSSVFFILGPPLYS